MSAIEITTFHVVCPYCKYRMLVFADNLPVDRWGMNIILCCPEEGGCDNYFAYKLDIKVQSQTYTITKPHRIWEGM